MYMYLDLFEELLEGVVVRAAQLLEVDKVHLALRVTLRAHIPEAHTHTGLAKQYTVHKLCQSGGPGTALYFAEEAELPQRYGSN